MENSKEKILEKAFELGQKYFKKCSNCSQCSIAAIFEALGIWSDDVFKSASGLADGLGLTRDGACGALVGSSMAISYIFGREYKDFNDVFKPFKSYELVKELHDQYVDQYGTCRCEDVQKSLMGKTFNLWDTNELAEAMSPGGLLDHCPELVGTVAKLATKIILDNGFIPK